MVGKRQNGQGEKSRDCFWGDNLDILGVETLFCEEIKQ